MKNIFATLVLFMSSQTVFASYEDVELRELEASVSSGDFIKIYYHNGPRVQYPDPTNETKDLTVNVIDKSLLRVLSVLCDPNKSMTYAEINKYSCFKK